MAVLAPAEIVARLDEGIAAHAGSSWHPSAHTFDDFLSVADGAQRAHLAYVVAAPRTEAVGVPAGRGRRSEPRHVRTEVRIRFLHRLRVGRREDYLEALSAGDTLARAALAVLALPELVATITDEARRELPASSGGYYVGELALSVLHQIAT